MFYLQHTESRETREAAMGRLGISKNGRQRHRHDKYILDCYAAPQNELWTKWATRPRGPDEHPRYLATVLWNDDYMR